MTHLVRILVWLVAIAPTLVGAQSGDPIPLWPNGAPGALGGDDKDIPTLTPYVVQSGSDSSAAMIVFPGGGYGGLAAHEGHAYALWLNEHGISAFVLKYRLGSAGYRHPVMWQDAARSVRLVRSRAAQWNIDPERVGIIGSSAGGHLAATLLTRFDDGDPGADDAVERQSSRPTLGVLCYPVITMGPNTHAGSRRNLLGNDPSPELIHELSAELNVTPRTPPCFIWHTEEDKAVKVENSLEFAAALREAGVPFDLHVFQKGVHGLGLGSREYDPSKWHPWTANCIFWLREQGFIQQTK